MLSLALDVAEQQVQAAISESSSLAKWFTAVSHFWSVGPGISQTVFDGGLRHAQTDAARAAYDATVAAYRQTVLTAFQGVEDNLAALRILEQENGVQDEAVQAARDSVQLTTNKPVPGRHRELSQRDHGPDHRPDRRVDRDRHSRPADGRRGPARAGAGRRLDHGPAPVRNIRRNPIAN